MASERKINANRANASASTGPKTKLGRARAAQNALRHGLSLPASSDMNLSTLVDVLALEIVGSNENEVAFELARRIAEAQIDLHRVRDLRVRIINDALRDPDYDSEAASRQKDALVRHCAATIGILKPMPNEVLEALRSRPTGAEKLAAIMLDKAHQLRALERYERRAFSRRKLAIRALDNEKPNLGDNL